MAGRQVPEPSELIYAPRPTPAPFLVAAGLAGIVAATFTTWAWGVIGLVVALLGARAWWKASDDEISRMRREQALETAVIPADPVRRPGS